jgi:hypothetical protein
MARLNIERQIELEPVRIEYAIEQLKKLGIETTYKDNTKIKFNYKGSEIVLFPYSGWHSGKTITDGRGIEKLLKQLK